MTESRKPVALWWLGLLTLAYFLAGKLGLSLAVVNESVSPVWPPTGIAFASFLLLGPRIWPAIFAGAFLVNVTTTGSIATSIGIALGNTFEGRLGADLVRIFANGRDVFNRSRDVFKFVVLGGLFSTTVSATIGASILTLGGNANWREYPAIWFTWWLGDAVGALVVGPVLVLWSARIAVPRSRTRQLEGVGLFATVIAVGILVFYGFVGQPLTFLCFPPLVWAAFRFGQRETAAAIAIMSGLAIWGTVHGLGPFADGLPNQSLLLLQAFLGTMAVMSILIAAVVAERKGDEAAVAHLASIVEFSDDAIVSKTLDGVVTSWNSGAERLYGYSATEAVGRPISIIIPPDRPNELLRVLARVRRGGRIASILEPLERIQEVVMRMNQITRLEPAERQRHLPEMLDLEKSSGSPEPPADDPERAS